jgi:hypothetical protein
MEAVTTITVLELSDITSHSLLQYNAKLIFKYSIVSNITVSLPCPE